MEPTYITEEIDDSGFQPARGKLAELRAISNYVQPREPKLRQFTTAEAMALIESKFTKKCFICETAVEDEVAEPCAPEGLPAHSFCLESQTSF